MMMMVMMMMVKTERKGGIPRVLFSRLPTVKTFSLSLSLSLRQSTNQLLASLET